MTAFSSWRALFVREYLEHRVAFQWAPLGILALLAVSGLSGEGVDAVLDALLEPIGRAAADTAEAGPDWSPL